MLFGSGTRPIAAERGSRVESRSEKRGEREEWGREDAHPHTHAGRRAFIHSRVHVSVDVHVRGVWCGDGVSGSERERERKRGCSRTSESGWRVPRRTETRERER